MGRRCCQQEVDGEVQSLYREFQSEKEDLLDSIRLLGHQVLLKDAIIAAFIPQVSSSHTAPWGRSAGATRQGVPHGVGVWVWNGWVGEWGRGGLACGQSLLPDDI